MKGLITNTGIKKEVTTYKFEGIDLTFTPEMLEDAVPMSFTHKELFEMLSEMHTPKEEKKEDKDPFSGTID